MLSLLAACSRSASPIPDYDQARRIFWDELYAHGGASLYCGHPFGPGRHRWLNIEHVLPMSWVARHLGCGSRARCRQSSTAFNQIEADLHNLYPARSLINAARENMRYGIVAGESRRFGACDFEIDGNRRLAEPRPAVRGEIARAMLYMHERYGVHLRPPLYAMLIEWNALDPPDDAERARNRRIEALQGNRNVYIDDPQRATGARS